ncbi:MAG: DUF2357 domain-containing protein [Symbiobacteriia bacterium]
MRTVLTSEGRLVHQDGGLRITVALLNPGSGVPPLYAPDLPEADADLGMSPFVLHEWTEYAVAVEAVDPGLQLQDDLARIRVFFGDQEAPRLYGGVHLVLYANRIGASSIRCEAEGKPCMEPLQVEVLSRKLSLNREDPLYYPAFYRRLVEDTFHRLDTLPYGFFSPTSLFTGTGSTPSAGLFHYHFLRRRRRDLIGALQAIAREPHRALTYEEVAAPVARVQRLDSRTAPWLLQHPRVWVPAAAGANMVPMLATTGERLLPERVLQDRAEETFDTPENRFARHFVTSLNLVARRLRPLVQRLHLPADALDEVDRELREAASQQWFQEVGALTFFPTASHVLQRRDGYRDLYDLYRAFLFSRTPFTRALQEAVANRDVATLYECWCYLALSESLEHQFGPPASMTELATETGGLRPGLRTGFRNGATLFYNRHFTHGRGSYSVGLQPDFTVMLADGDTVSLDAKFRFQVPARGFEGISSEAPNSAERDAERTDIYKMHTYRDALGHRAVVILYPGDRSVFYRHPDGAELQPLLRDVIEEKNFRGVGALSLRPLPDTKGEAG